jgi:dTDP-4-dehydrorhamnose 3,5-epimerase
MLDVERLDLKDVLLIRPKKFGDNRGYFLESYNSRSFTEAGIDVTFVQDNQSLSVQPGTIRGLHFQTPPEPQSKLVRVLKGSIFDVAVDLRSGSPTYGRWCGANLTAEGAEQFFVPRGFAHGFCTLEPNTEVAYKVDGFYAPKCDAGLRWDDPQINVAWPISPDEAILSEKDTKLPSFAGFTTPFAI